MITILQNIDVFVLVNYGHKITPFFNDYAIDLFIRVGLRDQDIDLDQIKEALKRQPPSTTHVVQRLHSMGIQPKTIAEWLDVNQSSVSYHLNKPKMKPYKNYMLDYFVQRYNSIFANTEHKV